MALSHFSRDVRAALATLVLSTSAWVGCSVDERLLSLPLRVSAAQPGGSAGTAGKAGLGGQAGGAPVAGSNNGGGFTAQGGSPPTLSSGGNGGKGGEGSGGTSGEPVTALCPDLNGNGIGDCSETLALNAGFAEDLKHWAIDQQLIPSLVADASGDPNSGALNLELTFVSSTSDGQSVRFARQCVPVAEDAVYDFRAQVFIAPGQTAGTAQMNVAWYGGADCIQAFIPKPTGHNWTGPVGIWKSESLPAVAPPGAKSAQIMLSILKKDADPPFQVSFDNVLFTLTR